MSYKRHIYIVLVLGIFLAGCAGIRIGRPLKQQPGDWLMYGGAATRVNQSNAIITPPLYQAWEYNALAGIATTPLVRDSVMIIGTLHGELQAVNLSNGKRLGYIVLESAVAATPAWDGAYVYVPSAQGTETLACIGIEESERKWVAQLGPIESSPLLVGDLLYVVALDGTLYCLNKKDAAEVWKFVPAPKEKRMQVHSSPATDGNIIVFGSDEGCIYAVDRLGGQLRWKYQVGGSVFATPIITEGKVVVGSTSGLLVSLNANDGTLVWKYDTGSRIFGAASATKDLIFVGSADGHCHAVKSSSGAKVWTFSAKSVLNSAPLVAGNILYLGSLDRTLYALRVESGEELWQYAAPGRIRVSPVIWGTTLLLTYEDKFVSALRAQEVQ